MKKVGKVALRAHLKTLPLPECREQILELWKRFPVVRDYFASRLSSDGADEVLERSMAKIRREFTMDTRSPRGDPAVARAVITEFRRSHVRPEANIQLLLFYVEA